jgi:putative ATP-dependent endonuclease of the OLD family
MFLSKLEIENFRCFGEGAEKFRLSLKQGLTALVGENDCGKTAVVDALRFVLGTTDQEWYRLDDDDFHVDRHAPDRRAVEIRILCKFDDLKESEQRPFLPYLTYATAPEDAPSLYLWWIARQLGDDQSGRPYKRVVVNSGRDGTGPAIPQDVRDFLRATYLRPLRDANRALSAGRGSRLAQVLQQDSRVRGSGDPYDPALLAGSMIDPVVLSRLSVLGIADLANDLLQRQASVSATRGDVDAHLSNLALARESIRSAVSVTGTRASEELRLRQMLEKLDLSLGGPGEAGLGSNNLLFMACELLLLSSDATGHLLLIEEPEVHLHAQRQLRVMDYMQRQAKSRNVQILVTTHSPNLASAIKLDNIVILRNGKAYPLAREHTRLEASDYSFMARFLDVTKANLFFARGVLIVEGDSEALLLPTLARLVGRGFTEHGVSVVNVGGTGLRRYARIFQRKDTASDTELEIPVACLADLDVMPNCAPGILGLQSAQQPGRRRWKTKDDIADLPAFRLGKEAKASGQYVRTFVSDEWTLEYSLALGVKDTQGRFRAALSEDVHIAISLAADDEGINAGEKSRGSVIKAAHAEFLALRDAASPQDGCTAEEVLATKICSRLVTGSVSKAVASQHLAEWLRRKVEHGVLDAQALRSMLPAYLRDAIDYVTENVDAGLGARTGA